MEDRADAPAEAEYETNNEEDLCSAPTDGEGRGLSLRPLLVFRHPRAHRVADAKIRSSAQAVLQYSAARQFAEELEKGLEPAAWVLRTDALYFPASDPRLMEIVRIAQRDHEILVIDDFFRLLDCRDIARARRGLTELRVMRAPIFSLSHGCFFQNVRKDRLEAQLCDRVWMSEHRSNAVREGLARSEWRDPPARNVIEKAGRAKKRRADARAAELMPEIERVRAGMPEQARSSRTAIADALNAAGVATPSRKGKWQGTTVKRVLDRVGSSLDD